MRTFQNNLKKLTLQLSNKKFQNANKSLTKYVNVWRSSLFRSWNYISDTIKIVWIARKLYLKKKLCKVPSNL